MLVFRYNNEEISGCFESVLIPCGIGEFAGGADDFETWRVSVVCMPSMSCKNGGQVSYDLSRDALNGGRSLRELLSHHPLLCRDSSFTFTLSTEKQRNVQLTAKRVSPECSVQELIDIMQESLDRTGKYFHARTGEEDQIISKTTETLTEKNFVDIQKIYQNMCGGGMRDLVGEVLSEPRGTRQQTWASTRLVFENRKRLASLMRNGGDSQGCIKALDADQDRELTKYKFLLSSGSSARTRPSFEKLSSFVKSNPAPDDLVFAILQNADLARQFGLVVDYDLLVPARPFAGKPINGILALTFTGPSEKGSATKSSATAVSRHFIDSHLYIVEPLSRYEHRKLNLLTCLTSEETVREKNLKQESDSERDYALMAFSVDHSIIKDLLLPQAEDFNGYLEPQKYSPIHSLSGTHPLSGAGVTLLGPKRDLVSREGLSAFFAKQTIHDDSSPRFLENLWNGYRFDVAQQDLLEGKWVYRSIHSHSLKFKRDAQQMVTIRETEDYISKDQRTEFNKPEGVCQSDIERVGEPKVHPALFTWNGMGIVQQVPWSHEKGMSPYKGELLAADYVRDDRGKVLPRYPTLEYGASYKVRARTVFQAGVGLSSRDADKVLEALEQSSQDWKGFEECLTLAYIHTRNRPYSPGTLVFDESLQDDNGKGTNLRFFLDRDRDEIDVWLFPMPIDREEARIHGVLRRVFETQSRLACVEGRLGEFLKSADRSYRSCIEYVADPDVTRVAVSSWLLGNYYIDSKHAGFKDRRLLNEARTIRCTDVEPYLIGRGSSELSFGSNDSFKFRPIRFRLRKARGKEPWTRVRRSFLGVESYEVFVPEADVVRLEIVPVLTSQLVLKSTFCTEYLSRERKSYLREKEDRKILERLSRMPGVTAPVHLEIVHAAPAPLVAPRFNRLAIQDGDNREQTTVQAYRKPNETAVHLGAGVDIDARTTGGIRLVASWTTYTDNKSLPGPSTLGTPSAETESRPVYFGPARDLAVELAPGGVAMETCCDELYCAEETVVYQAHKPSAITEADQTDASVGFSKIEMGDLKHHKVKIRCVAKGRYASRFLRKNVKGELESEEIEVNIPSSQVPMSPEFSHVIPWQRKTGEREGELGYKVEKLVQKLRIYLRRPWDNTGKGEMLAVLFDRAWRDTNTQESLEVPNPATSWGEDPVFRTYESETTDNLSPGILMKMLESYAKEAKFDDTYPVLFESELTGDTYNLIQADRGAGNLKAVQDYRNTHIVCVRPSYDGEEKMWYVDLDPGDRMRWFRFNTRTFQPQSLPGYHLSRENVTLNFFSTRTETIAVTKRVNIVEISLDTVPYSGQHLHDGLADPANRFRLVPLVRATDGVLVKAEVESKPPAAVSKPDKSNMRYVWKLPAEQFGLIGIWDDFKMKYVGTIEVGEL